MKPFQIAGSDFESSIAIDTSNRGNATVTVASEIPSRSAEFEILEIVCKSARQNNVSDFRLFNRKARDIGLDGNEEFFEDIIDEAREYITGYQHLTHGNESTHEIEAVHSAILLDTLLDQYEDRLVIIDGGVQKATPTVQSLSGLRDAIPSVTHCTQSEHYYPQCLLSDLVAFYLSSIVEEDSYDYDDPFLRAPYAERTEDRWGTAFAAMKRSAGEYRILDLTELRGETPKERAQCWFQGGMARQGAETPATDSITPITKIAADRGFDNLQAELERIL